MDTESGLVYLRARSYDSRIGRFVQKEPIHELLVSEHYRYVGNRPTFALDPSGSQTITLSPVLTGRHGSIEKHPGGKTIFQVEGEGAAEGREGRGQIATDIENARIRLNMFHDNRTAGRLAMLFELNVRTSSENVGGTSLQMSSFLSYGVDMQLRAENDALRRVRLQVVGTLSGRLGYQRTEQGRNVTVEGEYAYLASNTAGELERLQIRAPAVEGEAPDQANGRRLTVTYVEVRPGTIYRVGRARIGASWFDVGGNTRAAADLNVEFTATVQ